MSGLWTVTISWLRMGLGRCLAFWKSVPGGDVLMFPLLRRSSDDCSLDRLDYHIPSALFNSGKESFRQSIVSYFGWAQRYVIRRSLLLTDYWLRFPVGLLHEDTYFGTALIYSARTVYVMSEPLYIYRSNRQESIMAEPSVERTWSRVEVYRRLMVFATKKVAPEDQSAFRSFCFNNLVYSYDERLFGEKSFDFFVQSNGEYLYHQWCLIHPEASAITRMGRRLFFSSPRIYRMLKH